MEELTISLSTIEQPEELSSSRIEISSPAVLERLLAPYNSDIDMDSAKLYLEKRSVFLASDRETGEDISHYQYKLVVRDSSGQTFDPRESSPLGQLNRLFNPEDEHFLRNPEERDRLAQLLQIEEIEIKDRDDVDRLINLMLYFGDLSTEDLVKIYKLDRNTSTYPFISISGITPQIIDKLHNVVIASIHRRFPHQENTLVKNSLIWDSLPDKINNPKVEIRVEEFEDCIQIRDADTGDLILQIGANFLPKAWLLYLANQDCQNREDCSIRLYPADPGNKVIKI